MLTHSHDRRDGDVIRSFAILTDREQQVVTLVGEGLSNKLIARRLEVSEGTVKAHLHSIFRKLGIRSRITLIHAL